MGIWGLSQSPLVDGNDLIEPSVKLARIAGRRCHTVADMVFQQPRLQAPERRVNRRDRVQNLRAFPVVLNHPSHPLDLPGNLLNPAHQRRALVTGSLHGGINTPYGYKSKKVCLSQWGIAFVQVGNAPRVVHPRMPEESVHHPHDKLFKVGFSDPETAAGFLRGELPAALGEAVDWSRLRLEPGTFIDTHLRVSASDLLFSAPVGESECLVYILFEH